MRLACPLRRAGCTSNLLTLPCKQGTTLTVVPEEDDDHNILRGSELEFGLWSLIPASPLYPTKNDSWQLEWPRQLWFRLLCHMMYMFCTKLSITRLNVILFILYLPSHSFHLNEPGEEKDPIRHVADLLGDIVQDLVHLPVNLLVNHCHHNLLIWTSLVKRRIP